MMVSFELDAYATKLAECAGGCDLGKLHADTILSVLLNDLAHEVVDGAMT